MEILNLGAQESDIKSLCSALPCYNKIQSKSGQVLGYRLCKAHHGVTSCPFPGLVDSWHYPCFL